MSYPPSGFSLPGGPTGEYPPSAPEYPNAPASSPYPQSSPYSTPGYPTQPGQVPYYPQYPPNPGYTQPEVPGYSLIQPYGSPSLQNSYPPQGEYPPPQGGGYPPQCGSYPNGNPTQAENLTENDASFGSSLGLAAGLGGAALLKSKLNPTSSENNTENDASSGSSVGLAAGLVEAAMVNRIGDPCKLGSNSKTVYCGKKVSTCFNSFWDGYCGPNDGPQCENCEILQSSGPGALGLYAGLGGASWLGGFASGLIGENILTHGEESRKNIFNKNGDKAVEGENGKLYCGKEVQCDCCDGCGLIDGCNCSACMKLDVQTRGLGQNYLVNKIGDPSKFNTSANKFYCGKKVGHYSHSWDGHCGPNYGDQCKNCKILQSQSTTIYAGIY